MAYGYYGGNGLLPCDWGESEEYLLRLYRKKDYFAANSLGYIYYSDRLGEPDYKKAFKYFSAAAKEGIVEFIYKLSDMYRKGHGTRKDTGKAIKMLREVYREQKASYDDGYYGCKLADIALRLGYCYRDGDGVRKNQKKAREYFDLAKEAIVKRMNGHMNFGDEVVLRNITQAVSELNYAETPMQ